MSHPCLSVVHLATFQSVCLLIYMLAGYLTSLWMDFHEILWNGIGPWPMPRKIDDILVDDLAVKCKVKGVFYFL